MVIRGLTFHLVVLSVWMRGLYLLDFSLISTLGNMSCQTVVVLGGVGVMRSWLYVGSSRIRKIVTWAMMCKCIGLWDTCITIATLGLWCLRAGIVVYPCLRLYNFLCVCWFRVYYRLLGVHCGYVKLCGGLLCADVCMWIIGRAMYWSHNLGIVCNLGLGGLIAWRCFLVVPQVLDVLEF